MSKRDKVTTTEERVQLASMRAALAAFILHDGALSKLRLDIGKVTFSKDNFSFRVTGAFPGKQTKEESRWTDFTKMATGDWIPVGGKVDDGVLVGMTQGGKLIVEINGKKYITSTEAGKVLVHG